MYAFVGNLLHLNQSQIQPSFETQFKSLLYEESFMDGTPATLLACPYSPLCHSFTQCALSRGRQRYPNSSPRSGEATPLNLTWVPRRLCN